MIIETQTTPNNNVMIFFPPRNITSGTILEVSDSKSLRKSPLAEQLFDIGDIETIIIAPDTITITKKEISLWEDLKPQILAEIMDFLASGVMAITENYEQTDDNIIKQINGLIDARIRPAINQDGGDIEFKSFKDGVVYVELKGNCIGCAYAMITLKEGVEKLLRAYIPEVKEVRSVDKKII